MDATLQAFWDNPMFSEIALPGASITGIRPDTRSATFVDGRVAVPDAGVKLGYRFYPLPRSQRRRDAPLIVHFHGNAEVVSYYGDFADMVHGLGASLLCVDFRGFGWSSGTAKLTALASDAEAVIGLLPRVKEIGDQPDAPVVLFGRSIGSVCAIHLAHKHPEAFAGLALESGIAKLIELPVVGMLRMMLPPQVSAMIDQAEDPDPFRNLVKIATVKCPVLVIHGEADTISPIAQGEMLHKACPSTAKTLKRVPGAGHNDLMARAKTEYASAMRKWLEVVAKATPAAKSTARDTTDGAAGAGAGGDGTGAGAGAGAPAPASATAAGAAAAPATGAVADSERASAGSDAAL